MCANVSLAQLCLCVHLSNGERINFSISDLPEVSFSQDSVFIECSTYQVVLGIEQIKKYVVLDSEMDKSNVEMDNCSNITVRNGFGHVVMSSFDTNQNAIDALAPGCYFVSTAQETLKILKK